MLKQLLVRSNSDFDPSIFTMPKANKAMKTTKAIKKAKAARYPAFAGASRLTRAVPPPKAKSEKAVNYKVAFQTKRGLYVC